MARHLLVMTAAALLSAVVISGQSALAAPVFTQIIGDADPGAKTISFSEFAPLTDIGGGAVTPVPGHGVTLESSRLFRVFDLGTPPTTPPTVPGFFGGNILAQPSGSTLAGSFFVNFSSPVSVAGLVLANNFGTVERFYSAKVFDKDGNELAEENNVGVTAAAEFLGFKSALAEIARLEINFGPTFGTGQRPFIDSITYQESGSPSSVIPLPGALPLMAGGIGLLVLLGRRRKEKSCL